MRFPRRSVVPLACCVLSAFTAAGDTEPPPNFLVVLADDCTFRDIGCYGGQAHTPEIDRLASEGMQFTRCFQAAPMCSPTRHNLYTGQYPVKTGAYPNHTFVKSGTQSIADYLKPAGYRIALSGKKHINPKAEFPFEYSGKGNNPDMQVVNRLFAECADSETPFCLLACSNEPHTPWNKGDRSRYPPEEIELPPYIVDTPEVRESFSKYLAEVTYFDGQVGRLLTLLEEHGLAENTVVIVLSEQGNALPFAKWTCYDSGLQSAMLVRWPGRVEAGSVSDAMVEYVDLLPTLLDLADIPADPSIDGRSFQGVLAGNRDHHKEHVFGIMTTNGIINGTDCYPIRSVRSETHKLIVNLNDQATFTNACTRSQEFRSMVAAADAGEETAQRLVKRYQHRPAVELYDVRNDPLEMTNLADAPGSDAVIAELQAELDQWMQAQGDRGFETELAAPERQWRNRNRTK